MIRHKTVGIVTAATLAALTLFAVHDSRVESSSTAGLIYAQDGTGSTAERALADGRPSGLAHAVTTRAVFDLHDHASTVDNVTQRELAPSKPMSALHFVKPKRYLLHSGETVRVSLTLVASQLAERVMVTARPNTGTELVSKPQFFLGSLEPWQEATVWFDVTVLAQGRHYVSVVAQAETPAGPRFTSYSVPVEALLGASPKVAPAEPAVYDAQGNRLKLMPATNPDLDSVLR